MNQKKVKKRWLRYCSLLLAIVMIISCLSGCGLFDNKDDPASEDKETIVTQETAKPTEEPAKPTEEPAKPTEEPAKPTEEPAKPTEAPVKPTEAPVKPTEAPTKPTEAPVKPTEAPVKPTEAPVKPEGKWELAEDNISIDVGTAHVVKILNNDVPDDLTWTSRNPAVVQVSQLGTCMAMAKGQTELVVTDGRKTRKCSVTVEAPVILLSQSDLEMTINETAKLNLTGTSQIPVWSSGDESVAKVSNQGLVTATGAGKTTIYAELEQEILRCEVSVFGKSEGTGVVTRGQWIQDLAEIIGVDGESFWANNDLDRDYADSAESVCGMTAEALRELGVLPADEALEDVPLIRENDPATREFAAVTAVRALSFVSDGTRPDCTDSSALKYPLEVEIALQQAFLRLREDGSFAPAAGLTVAEEDHMLTLMYVIENSTAPIPGNPVEHVEYAPDVMDVKTTFSHVTLREDGKYEVCMTGGSEVHKGHVLLVTGKPDACQTLPLRVEKIVSRDNDKLCFIGIIPEKPAEVFDRIQVSGTFQGDASKAVSLLEGATMSYDPTGRIADGSSTIPYASFPLLGKLTFDLGDGVDVGSNAKLSGKVEVEIPDVTINTDIKFHLFKMPEIKEFTASARGKVSSTVELKYTAAESHMTERIPGSKELVRIPVALGSTGFTVDLVLSAYWDIYGQVSLVYTADVTMGIQIRNGSFRRPTLNLENDLQLMNIEGTAEAGLRPALNFTLLSVWDIIGGNGKIGPKLTVKTENHDLIGIFCLDASAYLRLAVELNDETIIGEYLKKYKHYELSHDFFDEATSPLRLHAHFENFKKVPECTANRGSIDGYVFDEDGNPVKNVRVKVQDKKNRTQSAYTNKSGYYKVSGLFEGRANLEISANGFKKFSMKVPVSDGALTRADDIKLVRRTDIKDGVLHLLAENAVNAELLDSVHYRIYSGMYNEDNHDLVTEGDFGTAGCDVKLVPGNYTVALSADNYAPFVANVAIHENKTVSGRYAMSPHTDHVVAGTLRVVLTWGDEPGDLDAHMFGPNGLHTCFYSRDWPDGNLDRDDRYGNGTETSTIYSLKDGMYSFYIHDYTNRDNRNSNVMSMSNAKVAIYINDELFKTLNIPANKAGTVWHVFDYNAETDDFMVSNQIYHTMDIDNMSPAMLNANDYVSGYQVIDILSKVEKKTEITVPVTSNPGDVMDSAA